MRREPTNLEIEFRKGQGDKWFVPWTRNREIEYQRAYIEWLENRIKELATPTVKRI